MAILSRKMLTHVRSLRPTWDEDRHGVGIGEIYKPADAHMDLSIQGHLSPIQPDLRLGDMYSHFDPYGHALRCAYTITEASVQIIRRIENTLGIPYDWGVRGDLPTPSVRYPCVDERRGRQKDCTNTVIRSNPTQLMHV